MYLAGGRRYRHTWADTWTIWFSKCCKVLFYFSSVAFHLVPQLFCTHNSEFPWGSYNFSTGSAICSSSISCTMAFMQAFLLEFLLRFICFVQKPLWCTSSAYSSCDRDYFFLGQLPYLTGAESLIFEVRVVHLWWIVYLICKLVSYFLPRIQIKLSMNSRHMSDDFF